MNLRTGSVLIRFVFTLGLCALAQAARAADCYAWLAQSTTSAQPGQAVTFTAFGSCDDGLNEIGLEQCDGSGTPYANLGNVGTGGSGYASQDFSWVAPGPGTYYFDSYAWNVDRSQLTRTGVVAVTVAGPSSLPQAWLTPSATSAQPGQVLSFTTFGSCDAGLNEIGLEQCDGAGTPCANLGNVGAGGSGYASQDFYWVAPGPGTYYFDSYAWNVDRSQLTRTGIISVAVNAPPSPPQASLTPSATFVQAGQIVNFTASGSCDGGLNEIGLEQCDGAGTPYANLGNIGTGGSTNASQVFSWVAPGPGTYYFDSYAWNIDRTQLTRTGITTVTVAAHETAAVPQVEVHLSGGYFSYGQTDASGAFIIYAYYGEPISFTASATCATGLGELGLELCNDSGAPVANLDYAYANGDSDTETFTWTPPDVGSYKFDAYATSEDYSQITRSSLRTALFQVIYRPDDEGVGAGDDDLGGEPVDPENVTINGIDYTIHADGSVSTVAGDGHTYTFSTVSGGGLSVSDGSNRYILTPSSSGGGSSSVSINGATYTASLGEGTNGTSDGIMMDAFIVHANSSPSFLDWSTLQTVVDSSAPQGGNIGSSDPSNQTGARDKYPYAQMQHSSCVVAALRNALVNLGVPAKNIPSEAALRAKIASALNFDVNNFAQDGGDKAGIPTDKILDAINVVLQDFGFQATNPKLTDIATMSTALSGSVNGVVLSLEHVFGTPGIDLNHILMVRWTGNGGMGSFLIDSGDPDPSSHLAYKSATAAQSGTTDPVSWIGGAIGHGSGSNWTADHVYIIHRK